MSPTNQLRILLFSGLLTLCLLFSSSFRPFLTIPTGHHTSFPESETQEKQSAKSIVTKMLAAADALRGATFDLKIQERTGTKFRNSTSHVKLQRVPEKIYIKMAGPELLFVKGWNNDKVLVNPAGFPYVDLNLDVNSAPLHKDQHHTMHEVGFDFLAEIIRDAILRTGPRFDEYFKYDGMESWNNISCYKITITDAEYKFSSYISKQGESLISIARRLKLSEFKIGELNKLTDYDVPLKPGKILVIPTSYARMTELLIDPNTWLPLSTKVYDNAGLFEAYEYINLKVNPSFASNEFTKDFKGYGF
jgi:hypothetical protein